MQTQFIPLLHEEEVQEDELPLRRTLRQPIQGVGELDPRVLKGVILALNFHPGGSVELLEFGTLPVLNEKTKAPHLPLVRAPLRARRIEPLLHGFQQLARESLLRRHVCSPISSVAFLYPQMHILSIQKQQVHPAVLFFAIYFLFAKYFCTAASVTGPYHPVDGVAAGNNPRLLRAFCSCLTASLFSPA